MKFERFIGQIITYLYYGFLALMLITFVFATLIGAIPVDTALILAGVVGTIVYMAYRIRVRG